MWSRSPAPLPPPAAPSGQTPGLLEARAARKAATDNLVATIERGPEVRETVRRVEAHGRTNHFFELMEPTLPWTRP